MNISYTIVAKILEVILEVIFLGAARIGFILDLSNKEI
jgi:hypothetical protein